MWVDVTHHVLYSKPVIGKLITSAGTLLLVLPMQYAVYGMYLNSSAYGPSIDWSTCVER